MFPIVLRNRCAIFAPTFELPLCIDFEHAMRGNGNYFEQNKIRSIWQDVFKILNICKTFKKSCVLKLIFQF